MENTEKSYTVMLAEIRTKKKALSSKIKASLRTGMERYVRRVAEDVKGHFNLINSKLSEEVTPQSSISNYCYMNNIYSRHLWA